MGALAQLVRLLVNFATSYNWIVFSTRREASEVMRVPATQCIDLDDFHIYSIQVDHDRHQSICNLRLCIENRFGLVWGSLLCV